jgi:hypothetical protein
VEYLKDVGVAQVLKQFVGIEQGLGMLSGSTLETFPQRGPGVKGRQFEGYGARHRAVPFSTY